VKRAIGVVVVTLALFWVITDPESAAAAVNAIFAALAAVAESIIVFLQSLFTDGDLGDWWFVQYVRREKSSATVP
jgi:hypothetical protein